MLGVCFQTVKIYPLYTYAVIKQVPRQYLIVISFFLFKGKKKKSASQGLLKLTGVNILFSIYFILAFIGMHY